MKSEIMLLRSLSRTVRIWDLENGKELHKLEHSGECMTFDFNANKTLLAVGHETGISIWNWTTRTKAQEIEMYRPADVRFNESGKKLIVGSYSSGEIFIAEQKSSETSSTPQTLVTSASFGVPSSVRLEPFFILCGRLTMI